jgi:hypothetical protein
MLGFKQYLTESSFNKGDVAEAILGAAVVATFMKKDASPITVEEVKVYLGLIAKEKSIELDRNEQKDISITDKIRFRVGLPIKAMRFIENRENWIQVEDLFLSAVEYCNSDRRLQRQAMVMRSNQKNDDIFVNSDGTGDQKGTKADIKLTINDKKTKNQISLKVSGGDQFAQVSGVSFDKQIALWKDGLGLDVSQMKKAFDNEMKKFDYNAKFVSRADDIAKEQKNIVKRAAALVYSYAEQEMNKLFVNNDEAFLKNLIKFISKGIAGDEEQYIELVKLEKGKFKKIRTSSKKFKDMISNLDLVANMSKTGDPKIIIMDKNTNKPLIQIRSKIELASGKSKGQKVYKVYPRNYIEAPSTSLLYDLS